MSVSVEIEAEVLGIALSRPDGVERLAPLSVSDFTSSAYRAIWEAIACLAAAGVEIDPLSVADSLERRGALERVGGLEMLGVLALNCVSVGIESRAEQLRGFTMDRGLRDAGTRIVVLGDGAEPRDVRIASAHAALEAVTEGRIGLDGPRRIGDFAEEVLIGLDSRNDTGRSTGLRYLDKLLGGFRSGELILLAARPGMGKSALAMALADTYARRDEGVLFSSLEMPATQLIERLLASDSGVQFETMRHGACRGEEWERITSSLTRLSARTMFIDERSTVTPAGLSVAARRIKRLHGLSLVVVDYIQLMRGDARTENRVQEVTAISRGLKLLAKELNVPVLALSQLNRGVEQRQDKRPQLSDLRESGSLEQDADVVMMLYREEVYDETSPLAGYAELAVKKQRNGPLGTVWLRFDASHMRFESTEKPNVPDKPRETRASGYDAGARWGK